MLICNIRYSPGASKVSETEACDAFIKRPFFPHCATQVRQVTVKTTVDGMAAGVKLLSVGPPGVDSARVEGQGIDCVVQLSRWTQDG